MPKTNVPFVFVELALEVAVLVHPAVSRVAATTAVPVSAIRSAEARVTFFTGSPCILGVVRLGEYASNGVARNANATLLQRYYPLCKLFYLTANRHKAMAWR
jgi:hypothetical protein